MFRKLVPHSLTTQLEWIVALSIFFASLASNIPAYIILHHELEQQTWTRIEDGALATLALLDFEKARLERLVENLSTRPTLLTLLQNQDFSNLQDYLATFQQSSDIDFLIIRLNPSPEVLCTPAPCPDLSVPPDDLSFYFHEPQYSRLSTVVSHSFMLGEKFPLTIQIGSYLDAGYLALLKEKTAKDYILVSQNRILVTTVPQITEAHLFEHPKENGKLVLRANGIQYYARAIPLANEQGEVIAHLWTSNSTQTLQLANISAMFALILLTLGVSLCGLGLAHLFSKRVTASLSQLTQAAKQISRGDLHTPVPVIQSPAEIRDLGTAFEQGRLRTLQALDVLAQEKQWSETLIQSISEGIITYDEKGNITSFSQGAEKILGYSRKDVLGLNIDQFLAPTDHEEKFSDLIREHTTLSQINVKHRDGSELILSVSGARLQYPSDNLNETILVLRDITEEENVRRLRSYFLANISHEFRTPLSSLNASVELLLEQIEGLTQEEILHLLNSIHLSVTNLQTLIDNLLESASIEAGHFQIRKGTARLDSIIEQAIQIMRPLFARRNQTVRCSFQPDLPEALVDTSRLTQVIVNLLSNASKYSPLHSEIKVTLQQDNNHFLVEVWDQGSGIPEFDIPRLFSRFVRLKNTPHSLYGVGLGLSVVKAIIDQHGGQVGVRNNPHKGSIFGFTIPMENK